MVSALSRISCRLIFPECHQTQQKIFADFENTGKFASPTVGEGASTALQANIAALILAMITVSPNLLSAEFSTPGHRSADGVKGRVRGEGEPCPLQVDRL
jgi:hypothetical protein